MDRISGADFVDIGAGRRGFRDENLPGGVAGTVVTALWLNMVQEEVAKVIEDAGIALNPGDWTQLLQALNVRSTKRAAWVPVLSMTVTAPPGAPAVGDTYMIPAGATGAWAGRAYEVAEWTGASWTISNYPDGHGIALPDGRVFVQIAGVYVEKIAIDAQSGKWQYADDTGTADALAITLNPAPPALTKGMIVRLQKAANPNATAAPTLNVSGLGAVGIKTRTGAALAAKDLPGSAYLAFEYDGALWRVAGPVASETAAGIAVNNPIFPEITATGNAFTFTTSAGQLVINTALAWQHRGLNTFNTSSFVAGERTFATVASKTYHLVWDASGTGSATPAATYPLGRFSLIDRTAASPVETDSSYDSTFDRMLLARVTTSAGNVLTVVPLINKSALAGGAALVATPVLVSGNGYRAVYDMTFNWARSPKVTFNGHVTTTNVAAAGGTPGVEGGANYTNVFSVNRYAAQIDVLTDFNAYSNIIEISSGLKYLAFA